MRVNVEDFFPEELLVFPLNKKILEILQYVFDTFGDEALQELVKFYDPENTTQLDRLLRTYGIEDMVKEIVNDSGDTDYFSQNSLHISGSSNTTGNPPVSAGDLDNNTYWESATSTNEWLSVFVNLASPVTVRKIVIDNNTVPLVNCPNEFELHGSHDGILYHQIFSGTLGRIERKEFLFNNNEEYVHHRVLFKGSVGGIDLIRVATLELYPTRLDTRIAVTKTVKNLLAMKGTMKALYYTMAKSDVPLSAEVIEWFEPEFYPLDGYDSQYDLYGWADIKFDIDELTKPFSTVQERFNAIGPYLLPWYFHIYRWILVKKISDDVDLPYDEISKVLVKYLDPENIDLTTDDFTQLIYKSFTENFQMNEPPGAHYGDGSLYGDGTVYGGSFNAYNDIFYVRVTLQAENYGAQFGSTLVQADGTVQYDGSHRVGPNPEMGIFDFVTITTTT